MPHPITEVKNKDRSLRAKAKVLESELAQKMTLLKQLQEEREVLAARHTMLVSLCDSLYLLKEAQKQSQGLKGDPVVAAFIEEVLLLQQLSGIEYSGPQLRSTNLPFLDLSASAAHKQQPICPDEDPFLLMRFISKHPPHPEALNWHMPDVRRHCSKTVPQLAMALAKLEAGLADVELSDDESPSDSGDDMDNAAADGSRTQNGSAAAPVAGWVKRAGMAEHPIETIQRIQIEWLQIMGTLMDECRGMIITKLPTTNFDTGEVEKEPSKRRHMFAVRGLGLTQQQLMRFKVGFALFQRLQGQLAERQGPATTMPSSPAASASATAVTSHAAQPAAGAPPLPLTAAAVDFSSSTGARLEAEQAAAAALHKNFQKQRIIAGMQMFFIIGTLSWQQYAKLRVLMSPFVQFGPLLVACILEHAAEMDRQQQQQQQQQQLLKQKKKPGRKPAQQLVLGEDDDNNGIDNEFDLVDGMCYGFGQ